jgi:hypothetical protein
MAVFCVHLFVEVQARFGAVDEIAGVGAIKILDDSRLGFEVDVVTFGASDVQADFGRVEGQAIR